MLVDALAKPRGKALSPVRARDIHVEYVGPSRIELEEGVARVRGRMFLEAYPRVAGELFADKHAESLRALDARGDHLGRKRPARHIRDEMDVIHAELGEAQILYGRGN